MHPNHCEDDDGTPRLKCFSPSREHAYQLSLACSSRVESPKVATELYRNRGNESVGCVTLQRADFQQALQDAAVSNVEAELLVIDDSNCPGVPSEHLYLDLGSNGTKRARRLVARSLHEAAIVRIAADGWAYLDS